MELGIFVKTWQNADVGETFREMARLGFSWGQLNLAAVGEDTLPKRADPRLAEEILERCRRSGVTLCALSGTFNILRGREEDFARFGNAADMAVLLGIPLVTISTGTCAGEGMWTPHPDNAGPRAWGGMLRALERLVRAAEDRGLVLGLEPEAANVVSDAAKARRVLDYFGSPHLKIVMDGANLLPRTDLRRQDRTLGEAFRLLGRDIALAHGKDLGRDGKFAAPGEGALDYPAYLGLLKGCGYAGPLILHQLRPEQAEGSARYIRGILNGT